MDPPVIQAVGHHPYDPQLAQRRFTSYALPSVGDALHVKCSLTPEELNSDLLTEHWTPQRTYQALRNEVAAILFVRAHTTIPVPTVVGGFEDRGAYYSMMEETQGTIPLRDVPIDQRSDIIAEVDGFVAQLQQLRSRRFGGVGGDIVLPASITRGDWDTYNAIEFPAEAPEETELVFCHGDLHTSNILIDTHTMRVKCIVNWEFAGFYPVGSEGRWYLRDGPPMAIIPEADDLETCRERILKVATPESAEWARATLGEPGNQAERLPHADFWNSVAPVLSGTATSDMLQLKANLVRGYQLVSHLTIGSPLPPAILAEMENQAERTDSAQQSKTGPKNPEYLVKEGERARKRWEKSHHVFVRCLCDIAIAGCKEVKGFAPALLRRINEDVLANEPARMLRRQT